MQRTRAERRLVSRFLRNALPLASAHGRQANHMAGATTATVIILSALLLFLLRDNGCTTTLSSTAKLRDAAGARPRALTLAGQLSLPAEAIAAADAKFAMVCAVCHGTEGRADSVFAKNSPVTPKDLSDTAWQDSVDDEYLAKIIVEGGGAVGKSPLMSGAPDLKDKPEVLAAMIAKIRGFAN